MTEFVIRPATQADVPAICDIYNYFVLKTAVTFDLDEVSLENRLKWFRQFSATGRYRLFVAEAQGELTGFAYSLPYRAKAAYDTTVEATIYTRPGLARRGQGRALYSALFQALEREDVHLVIAVISQPNAASDGLHEKFGFEKIGVLNEVGYKFSRFHSTGYWQKTMRLS